MANKEYSTYYHHTDRDSVEQIMQSGVIKQSDIRQDDAAFGSGTYLTKVGPYSSRKRVAQNNYDGMTNKFWQSKVYDGKTDVAIALRLPKASVHQCAAKVGPYSSRKRVAQNNYDGMTNKFWQSKVYDGKTEKASVHQCAAGDRDVYLYEGDLYLEDAMKVDVYVRAWKWWHSKVFT